MLLGGLFDEIAYGFSDDFAAVRIGRIGQGIQLIDNVWGEVNEHGLGGALADCSSAGLFWFG